jgi:hypothetical protein
MLQKIKKWGIYGAVILGLCGLSYIGGYLVRQNTSTPIVVDGGSIVTKTNISYVPIVVGSNGGCSDVISRYNSLLDDYKYFLNAIPVVYDVTKEKIYFSLATQKYSLDYKTYETPRWSLSIVGSARASYAGGFYFSYGGGVIIEYSGFGAGVLLDSLPSASFLVVWRGITWK